MLFKARLALEVFSMTVLIDGKPIPMSEKSTLGMQMMLGKLKGTETFTFINCEVDPEKIKERLYYYTKGESKCCLHEKKK